MTDSNSKPMLKKSIFDPSFKYVNAADTNLRETFLRVRREMAAEGAPAGKLMIIKRMLNEKT